MSDFIVRQAYDWSKDEDGHYDDPKIYKDEWTVSLPHQCDEWEIAGGNYGSSYSHTEAVEKLEAFIDDATIALDHLKNRKEYGNDD